MRITIIANAQISYKSMGGSDKIFIEMAKSWKDMGHTLAILGCCEAGAMCERSGLAKEFITLSRFDVEKIGLFFAYSLRTLFSLRGKIVKEGVLYSSSDFFPDLIFAFWQKLLNSKIKWIAGLFLVAPNPFKIKSARSVRGIIYWISQSIAVKLIAWKADFVAVLCQEDKVYLRIKGVTLDKIIIISGGVDLDMVNAIPEQERKYAACFVGRFHQQKGIPELIKIWSNVVKEDSSAKLAIVGWGDEKWVGLIKDMISQNKLRNNIDLLGYLDNVDKYKILKSSKVFLFPSFYESWGIVIAEAFSCGCPVVAFDIPATSKFKDGIITVELGKTELFANKVIELLKDQQLHAQYSAQARESSLAFSWKQSAKLLISGVA